jgi:hypothetical protein
LYLVLYLDKRGGVMRLSIEKQKVFLDAVCTGEFAVANALLAVDQSDLNLRISEAFPTDRASRLNLARFIAQRQRQRLFMINQPFNHIAMRLFEKTDGKEGPPLNALELLVLEGEYDYAKAVLALTPGLEISEAFPIDRASRLSLARFIAQRQHQQLFETDQQKQNFSERLFEKTDGKEGPPLNALELLVLEGEYDHAKAVLLLAPDLKISEAFPKDRASLGCLWQFILNEYAGLSEPLKQEVPKLLDLRVISKEEPPYNAFNVFLCSNNDERCLKTLTHASESALQPHHPDDEEMMDRALLRIIQAQLAEIDTELEVITKERLQDIMGPDHPVGTETLRGFIVVLAKETAQQQHFHEFCTLQSCIAAAEQKKALIEAITASMFFQDKVQYDAFHDALGRGFRVKRTDMLAGILGLSFCMSFAVFTFFLICSLQCMYSNVVSYSMLDILQFWKPHVADVLAWYGDVISPPINEARVLCLILVILLTLCVCSLLGTHISLRSVKRKQCQALDSQIQEDQSALNETKKALAQQVTETVEKPKLYKAYQRLAFMLMGGQNNDRVQIDDLDVEQGVGKRFVDQSSRQPVLSTAEIARFESELQEKIDQQQQAQSAQKIQSVFRGFCVRRSVASSAQCAPQAASVSGSAPAP